MNMFIIFAIGTFLFPIFIASYLNITTIDDLVLDKNKEIYAGKGEVCITPYSEINCKDGLKCVLISTTPHVNGICLSEDTNMEEDYINRMENRMKNKTLDSSYVNYSIN